MSYKAEILADSKNPQGDRITTMKVTFPRIVLAEFNTHRMFSRNSASSRAIPFKKMVQMVEENPFIPIAWQKDHKGMQGTEYLIDEHDIAVSREFWLSARDWAIDEAKGLSDNQVTKQLCNRLLEPFMWHTVIVTATEWENFFKLRCPEYLSPKGGTVRSWKEVCKDAEMLELDLKEYDYNTDTSINIRMKINKSQADIHIQAIAELMWDAMNESTPKELKAGEWHIPYGDNMNTSEEDSDNLWQAFKTLRKSGEYEYSSIPTEVLIATARCARISYQTLGDNPKIDYKADIRLHDILTANGHASPLEHIAKAMSDGEYYSFVNGIMGYEGSYDEIEIGTVLDYSSMIPSNSHGWCRNFKGFIQYRQIMGL